MLRSRTSDAYAVKEMTHLDLMSSVNRIKVRHGYGREGYFNDDTTNSNSETHSDSQKRNLRFLFSTATINDGMTIKAHGVRRFGVDGSLIHTSRSSG